LAVQDAKGWEKWHGTWPGRIMVDDMICFIVFEKGSVQSFAFIKKVHALDAVSYRHLGCRIEFPFKKLSVEALCPRYILNWDFEPAYLAKRFLRKGQLNHSYIPRSKV